jgi:hypothetical protein
MYGFNLAVPHMCVDKSFWDVDREKSYLSIYLSFTEGVEH